MERSRLEDLFRRWGHLQADLDPLGRLGPVPVPELDEARGADAERLRAAYCGPIGIEFMHILDPERRAWLAGRMEEPASDPAPDRDRILELLARAEILERFLHARYVGTKRYSLEGSAALLPLLDALLGAAAAKGVETALLAMSHRGRLAVMCLVARVPAASLFAGFEDVDPRSVLGSGDVKYHRGATGSYPTASGRPVHVHLVSNPSHLEAVDPVLQGRVRARQTRLGPEGRSKVLGVTLHGDAAFAGQGIAAETLNLAGLDGYTVGGSVHVIVNNLIGFTTVPSALYSSRYASDMALRLPIPVLHVNGFDPEAARRAAGIAADYRARFGTDVVLDLIGFRRYGHSEVEDPTTTQPLLYRKIESLPMLYQAYAERIGAAPERTAALETSIRDELGAEIERARAMTTRPALAVLPGYWSRYVGGRYEPGLEVPTAVPLETLQALGQALASAPEGFHVHPKVQRLLDHRREMALGSRPVDWAMAEALALGSILAEGTSVRFTGQDSRRGTFNQRHAVLTDVETGEETGPLAALAADGARLELYDSPLSEASVLGFEYGFSRDYPDALVCWEAQFGDFANGGQVIIDQFLSAGEDKWSLLSGLVLLLPHGYEGQGPEHSSARLERFLELAGEDNMQICQPSTAGQYFHLLRRQARRAWRKPLVVLTPKGLLRAPEAACSVDSLAGGRWRSVIGDEGAARATRVVVCSGKIAHELRARREKLGDATVAIVRLEQLYPFPEEEMRAELVRHPEATEVVWVQEEPANMGALGYVRPILSRVAVGRVVRSVKRSPSASTATGSPKAHAIEQQALITLAFARYGEGAP